MSKIDILKRIWTLAKGTTCKQHRKHNIFEFSIVFDDLLQLWDDQNGECLLSSISLLKFVNHKLFQPTLERIDKTIGFTKTNIALVCYCFSNQSDRSWIHHVSVPRCCSLISSDVPCLGSKYHFEMIRSGGGLMRVDRNADLRLIQRTLYRYMKRDFRDFGYIPQLDMSDIYDLIFKQRYRCALTDVPFRYDDRHPYTPSITRIDCTQPHYRSNIMLVINLMVSRNVNWTVDDMKICFGVPQKRDYSELLENSNGLVIDGDKMIQDHYIVLSNKRICYRV